MYAAKPKSASHWAGIAFFAIISLVVFLLIGVSTSLGEATTLKGHILLNELGGQPMSGVEVAAGGANPTESRGTTAQFTLVFPDNSPGDMVRVVVSKPGYVVVNDIQLELSLPSDPDANPLILLLCKEGSREEMRRRFYRLKTLEAVEEHYRQRVRKLEEHKRADAEALAKLRLKRDYAIAAGEKAAEDFAWQKLGETSEFYKQALRLFLDGKVGEALGTLDEDKLRRSLKETRKRKGGGEKEVAQAYMLKGLLLATQFRFEEAAEKYKAAVDASPSSFQASIALASFFETLNRHKEARAAYERTLTLARTNGTDEQIALTLNNLGIIYGKQNKPENAGRTFKKALEIRRGLAEKNPEAHLPSVADTLSNLGSLYYEQNRLEEAVKVSEEGLTAYRKLAEKNPEAYLPYVAKTLNSLGGLYYEQNRLEEAVKASEEALTAYLELGEKNRAVYLPYVAKTLNNLGNLYYKQNHPGEAEKALKEALTSYHKLVEKNPEANLPDLAVTLSNLGSLYFEQNRLKEVRKVLKEALGIRRELAEKNPEAYLPDLSMTLNNMGVLYDKQNQLKEAEKALKEALKSYRKLAEKNPEAYLPNVAMTLNNLGSLYDKQNQLGESGKAFKEALGIRRELAEKNPEAYLPNVADTLNNLGALYYKQNQLGESGKALREALASYRQLTEKNPEAYLPSVAKTLNNLGALYYKQNQLAESGKAFKEALGIYRNLARLNPEKYRPKVAIIEKIIHQLKNSTQ